MNLAIAHPWDLSIEEALSLQKDLAKEVLAETTFDPARVATVAGVDVGFKGDLARAAVVVLDAASLEPIDWAVATTEISFPYVPGLLTFREGPCVLAALEKLTAWPDLLVFDGHGLAHPRRIGLASHLGIVLDRPSIGCAKSRLTGTYKEPGEQVGAWSPLRDKEEVIGAVLRTRSHVRPVFVSIGHRVDLSTSVAVVLRCTKGYRLPETTRYAHKAAGGQVPTPRLWTAGRNE
jgi:deoxyribonuclease V